MATEQQGTIEPTVVEHAYETGTYFDGYTADGGLNKATREAVAEAAGQKGKEDSLDFRVVEDHAGHALKVEVTPKAKAAAPK